MKRKSATLAAALLALSWLLPAAIFAQDAGGSSVSTLRYSWFYGEDKAKLGRQEGLSGFNPEIQDQKLLLRVVYPMQDTDTQKRFTITRQLDTVIGTNFDDVIPLKNVVDSRGETHANAVVANMPYIIQRDEDPTFYLSTAVHEWGVPELDGYVGLDQGANMLVKMEKAPGTEIPAEDLNKMKLYFDVSAVKHATGGDQIIDPVVGNNKKPAEAVLAFQEGQTRSLYTVRNANGERSFERALVGGNFDPYNRYRGKLYDYTLRTAFTGPDAEALKQAYNLTLTGNDKQGWTVTVAKKEQPQPQPDPGVRPKPQPQPQPDTDLRPGGSLTPAQPTSTTKDLVPNTGAARR